jgi:hypothetical protein
MNCDQAQPLLDAFADGELGWGMARRVRHHLAGCVVCAAELTEIQQMKRRVRDWQNAPAPAGLQSRIATALPPDSVPASRRFPVRRIAVGMVGLAAATATFFWLVPGQPGRPTIALADVEQAMSNVKTMTQIEDNTYFDKNGKIVRHEVDQQWIRRDPPAIAKINLSKSPETGKMQYKQVLEDGRGQMIVMADGSYSFIDDSPENLKSIASYINLSTQTLSYMAQMDKRTRKRGLIQGEETNLDGQPALKFDRTWHAHIPTPIDSHMTVWLDPKTRRVIRMDGQEIALGKLVSSGSSTHFRYDETPPPGVFDIVPPPGAKIKDWRVRVKQDQARP